MTGSERGRQQRRQSHGPPQDKAILPRQVPTTTSVSYLITTAFFSAFDSLLAATTAWPPPLVPSRKLHFIQSTEAALLTPTLSRVAHSCQARSDTAWVRRSRSPPRSQRHSRPPPCPSPYPTAPSRTGHPTVSQTCEVAGARWPRRGDGKRRGGTTEGLPAQRSPMLRKQWAAAVVAVTCFPPVSVCRC